MESIPYTLHTTGRSTVPSNRIIELDGHQQRSEDPHKNAPSVPQNRLSALADYAQFVGFNETAASLEILRRQFNDNETFVPRYTGGQFDPFITSIAMLRVHMQYNDTHNTDVLLNLRGALTSIGEWVEASLSDPVTIELGTDGTDSLQLPDGVDSIGLEEGSMFNPTQSLLSQQQLRFFADGSELDRPPL